MAEKIRVTVKSVPESFRRAGFRFTLEAREVEVDGKTLAALKAEKNLVVAETKPDAETSGEKGKK